MLKLNLRPSGVVGATSDKIKQSLEKLREQYSKMLKNLASKS